jgi:hypothetical protein
VPLARAHVLFHDLGAENVGGHEVGSELNAAELETDGIGEGLDEQRLGEAGHAAQQAVPACKQTDKDLAPHVLLPDDDAPDLPLEPRAERGRLLEAQSRVFWNRCLG